MRPFNVIKQDYYNNYQLLPRTSAEQGFHREILDAIKRTVDYMTNKRKRTSAKLLTICFPQNKIYPLNNDYWGVFLKKMKDYFRNKGIEMKYVWAVEKGSIGKNIHYHLLLLLDGYKTYSFIFHVEALINKWASTLNIDNADGLIDFKNPDVFLNKDSFDFEIKYSDLLRRSSYLAKIRDKLNIPGVMNWNSSNLPPQNNTDFNPFDFF